MTTPDYCALLTSLEGLTHVGQGWTSDIYLHKEGDKRLKLKVLGGLPFAFTGTTEGRKLEQFAVEEGIANMLNGKQISPTYYGSHGCSGRRVLVFDYVDKRLADYVKFDTLDEAFSPAYLAKIKDIVTQGFNVIKQFIGYTNHIHADITVDNFLVDKHISPSDQSVLLIHDFGKALSLIGDKPPSQVADFQAFVRSLRREFAKNAGLAQKLNADGMKPKYEELRTNIRKNYMYLGGDDYVEYLEQQLAVATSDKESIQQKLNSMRAYLNTTGSRDKLTSQLHENIVKDYVDSLINAKPQPETLFGNHLKGSALEFILLLHDNVQNATTIDEAMSALEAALSPPNPAQYQSAGYRNLKSTYKTISSVLRSQAGRS